MILTEEIKNKNSALKDKEIIPNINKKIIKEEDKENISADNDNNLNDDDNINNMDYDGEIINSKINYDKQYDLEGDKIEKELNFYDFDEELLQYRPVEVDRLTCKIFI